MYDKVEFVRNKGEYAIRGDILDVFSPNEINPVRISFEFNDIESMYLFNLENTLSPFIQICLMKKIVIFNFLQITRFHCIIIVISYH